MRVCPSELAFTVSSGLPKVFNEITAADYVFIKRHVMGTYLINN